MNEPRLLLVPEVAERLRCSRPLVYKLLAAGDLPVIRIGTAIRIDAADLEAYILSRKASCLGIKSTAGKAATGLVLQRAGAPK